MHAVAYLRRVVAVGIVFFAGWSQLAYGPDTWLSAYGRRSSQSWMVVKAARLDEDALRAHTGGKVAWLVGSSILRESLDIGVVNEGLEESDSAFRVAMFNQGRGAAGLASGMLRQLPVRQGDLVIHNVAVQNMRRDWLAWTGLPAHRMSRMLSVTELWQTREWSLQDRLEQAAAVPPAYWRWHDETMDGLTAWMLAGVQGHPPRKKRPNQFYRHFKWERAPVFRDGAPSWEIERNRTTADDLDLTPRQFNIQGLERMRAHCSEVGVELVLVDIPPSAFAQWRLQTEAVRDQWASWRAAQPELVYAPQLPEADFYDRRHPNFRGRATLSDWMVDWFTSGRPRGEAVLPEEAVVVDYPWTTPVGEGDDDAAPLEADP